MVPQDTKKKFTFDFDERGMAEVNEQILDSYNAGYIDVQNDQSGNDTTGQEI